MVQLWTVVGGGKAGGIVVREGRDLKSPEAGSRLATGAIVEEVEAVINGRLHYLKIAGEGPDTGWISLTLKDNVLAKKVEDEKVNLANMDGRDVLDHSVKGQEPKWIEESRVRLRHFREGTKCLPQDVDPPLRLQRGNPKTMLPPFIRLDPKGMAEMSVKNLPGSIHGLKFPHNAEQLKSFGPAWYTAAFHAVGTLPRDNSVTKVVKVEQLPHSGFDACGGAGHKAFVTLEYAKPDPELHTELFAKFPWDYFESETGKTYRMQISAYGDVDSSEVLASTMLEHKFPFKIPKYYFADICRETTNYVLIVEKIPYSRRGKIENNKVVEHPVMKPFQIMPVCQKYQDYLLKDPAEIYYCIFRTMGHLCGWDQLGRYDDYLGPMLKYTAAEYLKNPKFFPRKQLKVKTYDMKKMATGNMIAQGIEFATVVAPQVFTPKSKDPVLLKKMQEEISDIAPFFDDIRIFMTNSSDYVTAMHMNLQADNAWFWKDEEGTVDCGVFDWCGLMRSPFCQSFLGCLSGADSDFLKAHDDGLMKMFCDEYKRYGGPDLDHKDVLMRWHLMIPSYVMDCCQWVERDIYRECPREEWPTITDQFHPEFVGRWNVRCRGVALVNAFEFWSCRNFKQIFESWKQGEGKDYITQFSG